MTTEDADLCALLRQVKPEYVAGVWFEPRKAADVIEALAAENARLRTRINRLIGLCKSYSGALLDSDYPPAKRDKLDALIGDIES
jgi:hypothetical protein